MASDNINNMPSRRFDPSDDGIDFAEIIKIVRLNLTTIILVSLISLIISGLIAYTRPDLYKSTAVIRIKQQQNNILENPFLQEFGQKTSYVLNEIEVINTYSFRERIYNRMLDSVKVYGLDKFGIIKSENKEGEKVLKNKNNFIEDLAKVVIVAQKEDLEIVTITAQSTSAYEAALICNLYSSTYQEINQYFNKLQLSNVRDFLKVQVESKFNELVEVEKALSDYQESGGIISLDQQAEQIINRLSEMEAKQNSLEIDKAIAETNLEVLQNELKKKEPTLAEYISNFQVEQYVKELQEAIAKAEVKRDMAVSGKLIDENSVVVKGYNDQIDELKQKLDAKLNSLQQKVYATTETEIRELFNNILQEKIKLEALSASSNEINSIIKELEKRFNKLPEQSINYARLQRNREVREKLYILVQEKYQEALVNEQSVPANVLLLDRAREADKPFAPSRVRIVLLGLVLGLALSIGFSIALKFFNNKVVTPEEVEKLGLKVLAWIPKVEDIITEKGNNAELIVNLRPTSTQAEAFRALRTRMLFMKPGEEPVKSLLITSSSPQEGKTFVISNLAASFAQSGKKTLLMDCDLRRPRGHKIFNFSKTPGLTDYFADECTIDDMIRSTSAENLDFVAAGKIPLNPAEILGSTQMKDTLELLKKTYDIILIDTPPIISVTDAEVLSFLVDASFLVVKSEQTDKDSVKKSAEIINTEYTHFAGTILNNFTIRKEYGAYYKYYYYYYADNTENTKRKVKV